MQIKLPSIAGIQTSFIDLRINIFFLLLRSPQWGRGSSLSRPHDHTQTPHTRWDSSGRVISSSQRPLPENTQHSQQKSTHTLWDSNPRPQQASGRRPTP